MVLLNSRITWLEETLLTYQFVNVFLDRIRWWGSASHVFVRLINSASLLFWGCFLYQERWTWMNKVEHEWQQRANKIGHEKEV